MAVEPQLPVTATNLAFQGQSVKLEEYPTIDFPSTTQEVGVSTSAHHHYEPDLSVDVSDLSNLNKEINTLRIRLHQIRKELQAAERTAARKKFVYESAKKRDWIGISGGSEKSREALAEIMNEELYVEYIIAAQVSKELLQHSRDTRTELDALKEISNNQRRQIDLM